MSMLNFIKRGNKWARGTTGGASRGGETGEDGVLRRENAVDGGWRKKTRTLILHAGR